MRVRQAYVSNSILPFSRDYYSKFDLVPFSQAHNPVVIFGMYEKRDYQFFLSVRGPIIVVWCGSDSSMITAERAAILKSKFAVHIVKSQFQSDDLRRLKILHKILPVSWQHHRLDPCPRGDNVYFYGTGKSYGENLLPIIRKQTRLNIIQATVRTFDRQALIRVYQSCFIGLRLTCHDGLPNTVLELGMMGRRSVYNGGIPGSIPWKSVGDVCQSVMKEFYSRADDDVMQVSDNVKKFIDIGNDWLNV